MYLHLLSLFDVEMAQVTEVLSRGDRGPVYPTKQFMVADDL